MKCRGVNTNTSVFPCINRMGLGRSITPAKRIPIMLDNIDKLEVSEIDEMIETLAAEKARRQEEEQHLNEMSEGEILSVESLPHGHERNLTPLNNISIRKEILERVDIIHRGMVKRRRKHLSENNLPRFPRKHTYDDTIELLICQGLGIDYFMLKAGEPDDIKYLRQSQTYSYWLTDEFMEKFSRIRLLTETQLDAMERKKKRLETDN